MALDLDARQEMKTAMGTVAEMMSIVDEALTSEGISEAVIEDCLRDYWHSFIVATLAPNPVADVAKLMEGMFPKDDDE